MRVLRFMMDNKPVYGVAAPASNQVTVIKGDPLFNQVEPSGKLAQLSDLFPLSPVIPRSKVVCLPEAESAHSYLKANTAVVGPDDPVVTPAADLAAEISVGMVVKTLAKNLRQTEACDAIFGWVLVHNFSASAGSGAAQLSFDTSCPLGPWILVEPDFVPAELEIEVTAPPHAKVSEGLTQMEASLALERASKHMTLLPGDIVVLPPLRRVEDLRAGDALMTQTNALGELRNPILASA